MRKFLIAWLWFVMVTTSYAQDEAQRAKALGLMVDTKLENVEGAALDPATQARLGDRMDTEGGVCAYPDKPDPEIAFATLEEIRDGLGIRAPDCASVRSCHRALLAELATGAGSYPADCHPDYPGVHAITWIINSGTFNDTSKRALTDAEFQGIIDARVWGPTGDPRGPPFTMAELKAQWGGKPMWHVLRDFTAETYRRVGVILIFHDGDDHNIHVLSRVIRGSTIGVGWYPGSSCSSHVEFHIDSGYKAGFNAQLGLWVHECGHTMQGPHRFSGQDRHQEPMSYRYNNHLVVGYSTGDDVFGLPRAPSMSLWTELYGGEPVGLAWAGIFGDEPPDPPRPPTGGGVWVVGQEITQSDGTHTYTLKVIKVDGDQGDTFSDRVADEYAKIPEYRSKEKHRASMAAVYYGLSRAVAEEGVSMDDAQDSAEAIRGLLLRRHEAKWEGVWILADSATNAKGLMSVATGLGYKPGDEAQWTAADMAYVVGYAQGMVDSGQALNPEIIKVIRLVLTFIPDGPLKTIIGIVLAILEGLPAEEQVDEQPAADTNVRVNIRRKGVRWQRPFVLGSVAV